MSDTPTPTVGRIVLVPMPPSANNGSGVAPAVVTRVNDDETINVRLLPDAPPSIHDYRRSLSYAEELDTWPLDQASLYFWTWPERTA
jgi:hypothetical protein